MRVAAGIVLLLAALPIGGYGLLYLVAITTSDSSTGTLIQVGGGLLAIAAAMIAGSVWLLRASFRRSREH